MKGFIQVVAAAVFPLLFMGCMSHGPRVLGPAQFDYNQTVATSWNEQLLLNIVRIHYRDTPVFLQIDQILAGYSFEKGFDLGIDVTPESGPPIDGADAGISGTLEERPTVTLSPMQGKEFTSQLHTRIPAETLFLLAESGWQIERIMMCCVHEVNGLRNLSATPDADVSPPPNFDTFRALAADLESMQRAGGSLAVAVNDSGQVTVAMNGSGSSSVRALLGLPGGGEPVRLVPSGSRRQSGELQLVGRSFFGVMNYLSRFVESPASHVQRGIVDPSPPPEGLFRVRSTTRKPSNAFVEVRYRGHWFSISDGDLDAKETFGLLTQLFSLQADAGGSQSPLLSIPAG